MIRIIACVKNINATKEEEEEINLTIPAHAQRICIYQYEVRMDNKFVNFVCNKHQITDCKAESLPANYEEN